MTRVAVSAPVLSWALERSGKAAAVKRKFPRLPEWLEGRSRPTFRQLESLAKATSTPFGYFFLPQPPEDRFPIPYFRTLASESKHRPSPDLLETVQLMERRQAWMHDYLADQGQEPLGFVRSASASEDPQEVAEQMRQLLGVEQGWAARQPSWTAALRQLQSAIDHAGILVVVNSIVGNNTHRKLDSTEFRGFVLVDEYAPLIFVNGADGKAAQMFTVAHELAHIWLGSSAAFDLRELRPADDAMELACNKVAAEFLIRAAELRSFWSSVRSERDRFQAVARRFKVSELVAARRALDLGLVTRNEFFRFYEKYQEKEKRVSSKAQEGGDFYATQNLRIGRRLAEAVVRAAREGTIAYREAYQLTGLYGRAFEQYAESLEFGAIA